MAEPQVSLAAIQEQILRLFSGSVLADLADGYFGVPLLSVSKACLSLSYRSGGYSMVEGEVEDFKPMPFEGHTDECFSV